jgi:hypothetical protein
MRSVARLVLTYFTRTPGLRWLTGVGLAALVAGPVILPRIATSEVTDTIMFFAGIALFLGTALMPMMIAQMVRSHGIRVLPYARLKLFVSALLTVMIVSLPLPLFGALTTDARLFWSLYLGTFLVATWLYLPIAIATTERNIIGLAKSLLLIIAILYVPTERIVELDPKLHVTLWESILTWAGIGAWIAYGPRRRNARAARKLATHYAAGRELDLLLGTARPGLLALAMLFPIAIQMFVGFKLPETWLFYLTLFSAVGGALAGRAAERSRSIWLRARWSREELFARVEAAFWKQNSFALVLLSILLLAVVRIYDLPVRLVPLGLPLLVLGMVLSTYVGFVMTRGLRWPEASLAIAVMLALMGVAVLAAGRHDSRIVVAFEIAFAILAVMLRFIARRRWHALDWTLCRTDRAESARVATQN